MLVFGLFLIVFNSSFILGFEGEWYSSGNISSLTIEKISFNTRLWNIEEGKCDLTTLNPTKDIFNRTTVTGYSVKIVCPVNARMNGVTKDNGIIEFYTTDENFNCNELSNKQVLGGSTTGAVIIKLPSLVSSSSNKEYKGLFTGTIVTHNLSSCPILTFSNNNKFYANDSVLITGTLFAFTENGNKIEGTFDLRSNFEKSGAVTFGGYYNGLNFDGFKIDYTQNNHEQRLSTLESWKHTIVETLSNISYRMDIFDSTLHMGIGNAIMNIFDKLDNQDTRIKALENQAPSTTNGTLPNYFKYLSSSDRKAMVCGYGQDNHLNSINDLGWSCTITYKVNQYTKKETSTCRCTGR